MTYAFEVTVPEQSMTRIGIKALQQKGKKYELKEMLKLCIFLLNYCFFQCLAQKDDQNALNVFKHLTNVLDYVEKLKYKQIMPQCTTEKSGPPLLYLPIR